MASLRTFLVLGRVSNLPTVWSNCLAGWYLGGQGRAFELPYLFAGTTFLYLGGMFLNDAYDADFDKTYRKERPIPSGAISEEAVWRWGIILLILGMCTLFYLGAATGALGLLLASLILLYDAIHKAVAFAPALVASCRFVLYLLAASASTSGVDGWAVWAGLALALYVAGLSFAARSESRPGPLGHAWILLLAAPVVLAMLMNAGAYRQQAFVWATVLVLWLIRCLRTVFQESERNIGRTVSGLLAGIVLVDWLAVADAPRQFLVIFPALFLVAFVAQKTVPAT